MGQGVQFRELFMLRAARSSAMIAFDLCLATISRKKSFADPSPYVLLMHDL